MEHEFSVEIRSKRHVRKLSFSTEARDGVLLEGCLGELTGLSMVEGVVLEVKGVNGVLRLDIDEDWLRKMLSDSRRELSLSSEVGSFTSTKKRRDEK
jgi:hypothetical protein